MFILFVLKMSLAGAEGGPALRFPKHWLHFEVKAKLLFGNSEVSTAFRSRYPIGAYCDAVVHVLVLLVAVVLVVSP